MTIQTESASALPPDPFQLFADWYQEARAAEPSDPNAMALATIDPDGRASVRIVLLKAFDPRGFVFYTNLASRKARALAHDPHASLCFHWKSLQRQVRVEGAVQPVEPEEADLYFASRPRISRLGAWASDQSRPLESRAQMEAALAGMEARYPGEEIPRPEHWSGFRLDPERIEFWEDRPFRLHERRLFSRLSTGWSISLLWP